MQRSRPVLYIIRLRCIGRPNTVMWILRGCSSCMAPTQQPRTTTCFIGFRLIVMWILHGSSSSMVRTLQLSTRKKDWLCCIGRRSGGHLVEQYVDVTAQDKHRSTPLHRASIKGHMDLTRFLVEHGADATAKTILQITSSDPGSCIYP